MCGAGDVDAMRVQLEWYEEELQSTQEEAEGEQKRGGQELRDVSAVLSCWR